MSDSLTFIDEAKAKDFVYLSNGVLGNGFYGNEIFVTLTEMEKLSSNYISIIEQGYPKINSEAFLKFKNQEYFYTQEILGFFPTLKDHILSNFVNKNKISFISKNLLSMINGKRVFAKSSIKYIYEKLVKKDDMNLKRVDKRRKRIKLNE